MKTIKKYFIKLWYALWAKTDLDEKAIATLKEAENRINKVKKELADVKRAAKEVVSQSKDVVSAAKGKKTKGKKAKK